MVRRGRRRWQSAFRVVPAGELASAALKPFFSLASIAEAARPAAKDRLLTVDEVLRVTGFRARSTLWRKERTSDFPARVRRGERTIAWRESEVLAWIAARPRKASPRG